MKAEELLVQMRKALADERTAIRTLDVKGVTRAGLVKEELLKAIANPPSDPVEKAALAAALKDLRSELRRNLILLAHARDCVRDTVTFCISKRPGRPRLQASL